MDTVAEPGGAPPRTAIPVSVAILSHRRPHLLQRVISAVSQLDYPMFEVVVVGDQPQLDDYRLPRDVAAAIRYVCHPKANIGVARNLAVEYSAGDVVAFCDDDAVPEPDWLKHLIAPFYNPNVGAVAGLVRGRDGRTVEWAGGTFDRTGREQPSRRGQRHELRTGEAQCRTGNFLGMMGANTAFRRTAVLQVGGFDEAIRYYLDETDIALRLAEDGWAAAFSPNAEVHHLREQNDARGDLRAPRNLTEIAASKAYFCTRHLSPKLLAGALDDFQERRLAELDPFLRLGMLRRQELAALMAQMATGIRKGRSRRKRTPLSSGMPRPSFRPFHTKIRPGLSIALQSGWGLRSVRQTRNLARQLAAAGHRVTCLSYFSGMHALRVWFSDGVWMHSGGTWRLDQHGPSGRVMRRRSRALVEISRIGARRDFDIFLATGRAGAGATTTWSAPGTRSRFAVTNLNSDGRPLSEMLDLVDRALTQSCPDKPHVLPNSEPILRRTRAFETSRQA
ncbi:MAG: glycosyltransferase family 2 protein [Pseudomonadota bacterium]